MHEFTVAGNIIDIVSSEAARAGSSPVKKVNLEIGLLAGIEYESLNFALEALKKGTIVDSASFIIEKPGGMGKCNNCGYEFTIESFLGSCSACGSQDLQIIKGSELRVKSITI
ncbi:MAG: hydrogenase maturation nickel metallochaperone HypA [Bacteroidales bacterium]|nr:hydrogenase maturation nickel metallochaperone HypA [Bacteroidales bacterium]